MSHYVASELSDRIAAIAPVAADLTLTGAAAVAGAIAARRAHRPNVASLQELYARDGTRSAGLG